MYTRCKNCGFPNIDDCLSAEGHCINCSTGDDMNATISYQAIRDSFKNIVHDLAVKVGDLSKTVRKHMFNAGKSNRNVS